MKWLTLLCGVGLALGDIAPCAAQSAPREAEVSARMNAATGIRRFVPGRWGLLQVRAANKSDQPHEMTTVAFFEDDPGVRFERQLWIPANSVRMVTFPVLAPADLPDKASTGIDWAQLDSSGSRETLTSRLAEPMFGNILVSVNTAPLVTGIMSNRGDADADAVNKMVLAMRFFLKRFEPLASIEGDFAPSIAEGYDGLDQLVLADDRLAYDSAGMTALRHWVAAGGRLWIMLDQVDPAVVELLLADAFRCEVVDRVGLTDILVEQAGSDLGQGEDIRREFEEPVELVRVLLEDMEVTHTVNGWPAAARCPLGRGEVFLTTLGARGWIRQRTPEDDKLPRPFEYLQSHPTAPLEALTADFLRPRNEPPVAADQLEPFLAQRIGYRIVSRSTVAGLLGGFCLALVATGVFLARRGRLEWLGVIGPGVAIAVGAVLVLLGMNTRSAAPPTVAELQMVHVTPGGYDAEATGLTAIYRPNPSSEPIHAAQGGVLMPDMTSLRGSTRRLVWTDQDAWTWRNLDLPGGIRTADVRLARSLDEPVVARATFGPKGLTGSLTSGPFETPTDAIIATPWRGNLAASLGTDGSFACDPGDLLQPGQFLADALLDDRQREHQSIYALSTSLNEPGAQSTAALLFWANPLDTRFGFPEDARRTGSALVCVPLVVERPEPGSEVVVPSAFLPYDAVPGPTGAMSAVYHRTRREWLPSEISTETWLRFQVPEELLPLDVNKATLTMKIEAPFRPLEILGCVGDRVETLAVRQSPAGVVTFVVERSTVEDIGIFTLDDRGGLTLGVRVGSDQPETAGEQKSLVAQPGRSWRIDTIGLDLAGRAIGVEPP